MEGLSRNHKALFTIHPYGHGPGAPGCPYLAKRTQFHPGATGPRPKNAKRTQFTVPLASRRLFQPDYAKQTQSPQANCQSPKPNSQKTRNEPNLPPQQPKNAKRTQFHKANCQKPTAKSQKTRNEPNSTRPTAKSQQPKAKKCETNPISHRWHPRLCETNPISHRWHPRLCETNPIYRTPAIPPAFPPPIMRNEPNSTIPSFPPPPISTKRTQFAPRHPSLPQLHETNPISTPLVPHAYCLVPQLHETNPISTYQVSHRPAHTHLSTRNQPNFRIPSVPPPPISAKRTQFTVPLASRRLSQTQLCETNPISRLNERAKGAEERLNSWPDVLFYRISGSIPATACPKALRARKNSCLCRNPG